MLKLVIATTNDGKVAELRNLLGNLSVKLLGLNEFDVPEALETGTTFSENSELKAVHYARQTNCWALADDSGLEVGVLGGRPGVQSARYAGVGSTDLENNAKLLQELSQIKDSQRLARFVCSISISDNEGKIMFSSEGICKGNIADKSRGANGFGYDPVFIPEGYIKTFGELAPSVKIGMSHRAKALAAIIDYLRNIPHS